MYLLIGLAVLVMAGLYWYATREVKTDVPDTRAASTKKGVVYNPNKDLWLTRATDVAIAIKQVDSDQDCQALVLGICGNMPPVGYSDERTWRDACACEVVGSICYPAWKGRTDLGRGGWVHAKHVVDLKEAGRVPKDVLPW